MAKLRKLSPRDFMLKHQREWAEDKSRFKIWLAARQIGKSFALAAEPVEDCFVKANDPWLILSAGERQALEFMDKVKMWAAACQLAIDDEITERTWNHPEALMLSSEIRFPNGSWIKCLPSNPDTISGYSANVIWDEAAKHDKAQELWRNFFPTITNPLRGTYKVRVSSTPMGKENKFSQLWHSEDQEAARIMKWSRHRTDIYDAVRNGLIRDGQTIEDFIAELREGLDDPDGWAQEYECEFLDSSNVLLPYDLITPCEDVAASEVGIAPIAGTYVGIDFGRTSDPTVCWTLQRVGDVLWTRDVKVIHKTGTPEQNEMLASRIKASRKTCIDWTGPGVGFGDYAAKAFTEWNPSEHRFGKVELCNFSVGFKREIFPALRRRFEQKKIRIPVNKLIREDLHAMQQVIMNGQYNYWAPRGKEGHSDRCTALALAVRAAGADGGIWIPKSGGSGAASAGRGGASRSVIA